MNQMTDKRSHRHGMPPVTLEQKISKTSRGITIMFQFAMAIAGFCALTLLIGIGVFLAADETTRESFFAEFQVVARDGMVLRIIPQNLLALFISLLIKVVFMWVIFYTVHRIFREISQNSTPFEHRHVVRIKRISLLVIAMSILSGFTGDVFDLYTVNKMSWGLDLGGVLLGVVIYCLAIFFDYGCELQRQSDETL